MKKIVFLDVETTGLNSSIHEIIEIAIIGSGILYNKKIMPLNIEYANPVSLKINGYNEIDWRFAIPPLQASIEIAEILKDATIIGHNINFDMDFINELLHQYDCHINYDRRLIDTMTLAHEHLIPCGLKSISLDECRSFFGWSNENAHTALKDAQDCMKLYLKLNKASKAKRFYWKHKAKIKYIKRLFI